MRCAIIHGARGDTEQARETFTTPPSAARSARCAHAGASLQRSTAAPEALHCSGPRARSGTTRWRTREEQQPHRLTMPRDALPTRLASFCLLAMASPPRDTRRNSLISQQTSGIGRGADRRLIEGALAAFLLTAGRVERRRYPLQSRLPGRDDGGLISQPDPLSDLLWD
jgi:hypothetical protein